MSYNKELLPEFLTDRAVLRITGKNPDAVWKHIEKNGWQSIQGVSVVIVRSKSAEYYCIVNPVLLRQLKSGEFLPEDKRTVTKQGGEIPTFDKIFGESATLLNSNDTATWQAHRREMNHILKNVSADGIVSATTDFVNALKKAAESDRNGKVKDVQKLLSTWTHQALGGQITRANLADDPERLIQRQQGSLFEIVLAVATSGHVMLRQNRDAIRKHFNTIAQTPDLERTLKVLGKHDKNPREAYMQTGEVAMIASTDTTQSAALYMLEALSQLDETYLTNMQGQVNSFFEQLSKMPDVNERQRFLHTSMPPSVQSFVLECLMHAKVVEYSPVSAANELHIPGSETKIPAGSLVIPMYSLISLNPQHWQEKELTFNPARFLPYLNPHVLTISDYLIEQGLAYFPFGVQDRNCSGRYLAILALNILTLHVVHDVLKNRSLEHANVKRTEIRGMTISAPLINRSSILLKNRPTDNESI